MIARRGRLPETRPVPTVVAQFLAEAYARQLIVSAPTVVSVTGEPSGCVGYVGSAPALADLARQHPIRVASSNRFHAFVSDPGDPHALAVGVHCRRIDGLLPWQATADVLLDWDARLADGTLHAAGEPAVQVAQLADTLAVQARRPPAASLADVLSLDMWVELDRTHPRGRQARTVLRDAVNDEISRRLLPGEFGTLPVYSDAVDLAARLLLDAHGSVRAYLPRDPGGPGGHEDHAYSAFDSLGVLETARAESRLAARQIPRPAAPGEARGR